MTQQTTILLIEDSSSDVRLVEELLHQSSHDSFHVLTAPTLAKGLELLSHNSVDIVLLDLGLPDSEGIATFHAVYKHAPHLPIVVFTVSDDEALGQQVLQEGALRFLSKDVLTLGASYARIFSRMIGYVIEQKRVEEARRMSEERLKTLFESSPIVQIRYDPEGVPVVANRAAREFLGINDVSAIHHLSIFTSPRVSDADKARLRAGKPTRYEQTYDFDVIKQQGGFPTTRSGVRYVDFSLAPIFDKDGAIEAYLAQVVDITERERAEEERESIAKFPEENPHPILRFTSEGSLLFKNRAGEVLVGNPLFPLDDVRELINQAYASGKERTIEVTDGTYTFQLVVVPIVDQGYVNVYGTNITKRKHAEEALQQAHEEVQALNEELQSTNEKLRVANEDLEDRVQERTEELAEINEELQSTNEELRHEIEQRTNAEQAVRTRARYLDILNRVIEAGNEADTLETALSAMVSTALELTNFDGGIVFLLNEAEDVAELRYAQGCPPHFVEACRRIPLSLDAVARVYRGEPLFLEDYLTEVTFGYDSEGMDVAAGIPLVAQNKVIGHCAVISAHPHHFTSEGRDLLVTLGREVGTVIARLQADEALKESEARYHRLVERSFDAVLIHSDGIIQLANDAAARILKAASPDELVGMDILDLPAPRYRALAKERISSVYETGQSSQAADLQYCALDGTIIDVEAMATLITYEGRSALYVVFRDIGERKGMEAQLKQYADHLEDLVEERTAQLAESEEQYRTLVETANSIIIAMKTDRTITFINDYGARFFGYMPDELIGTDVMILVPETESTGRPLAPHVKDILARPDEYATNLNENITKDGQRVWVQWVNRGLVDHEGRHIGHLAVGIDVTALKQTEAALKEAERLAAIGQTATMIGHDLRNPLQAIQLTVDLGHKLFDDMPPEAKASINFAKATHLFSSVEQQILYMDKIVSDLQDYARPLVLEREEVSVPTLIADTLSTLAIPEVVTTHVDVSDSITTTVDPHLMQRVLSNLIMNAVQAMPRGGELMISAAADDHAVVIRVHDTGEGVPKNMKDMLFSPLTTGKAKGTGLGLAVVKRIVEAHNGTITFESEEGKGTTFTVTLQR